LRRVPVFNLLKLHGSLSWEIRNGSVTFSIDLNHVKEVGKRTLSPDHVVTVPNDATIGTLLTAAAAKKADATTDAFLESYDKLLIVVNPTKEKFKHTLMNQTYYELLRLYNNELEKENTVLFVMGFSFADEHIREITLRAANSNPTLMIYVIAHSSNAKAAIEARFSSNAVRNNNVAFIAPDQDTTGAAGPVDKFNYDLQTINKQIYGDLLQRIDSTEP
jgi:SIR2-like domain